MNVEELFKQLSYGELSNLAIAVDTIGAIKKTQQNRVVHFANEALKRLHTRFALRERSISVTTSTTEDVVTLLNSMSDDVVPVEIDDFIKVISILTAYGQSLTFETNYQPGRIYVQDKNLHIPPMTQAWELQVNCQLRHPELTPILEGSDLAQEITLIPELHSALTAFIASEMYAGMNSADSASVASYHRSKYEAICTDVAMNGVLPSEVLPLQKFDERGFI